jgi:hypothetical protein
MKARKTTNRKSAGQKRKLDNKPGLEQLTPEFSKVVSSFADHRDVRFGRMFSASSVLNVNGKIFAMCRKGELVCRKNAWTNWWRSGKACALIPAAAGP